MSLPPWIFSLPDLHEFPEGSPPGPYGHLYPVRLLPAGLRLVAVGWLDGPMDFPKGDTAREIVSRLLELDARFLIDEGTRGWHSCYYCDQDDFDRVDEFNTGGIFDHRPECPLSHGHHLLRHEDVVYMCPALLPHYMVRHKYRPPDVFRHAVARGTFLRDTDLIHTGED